MLACASDQVINTEDNSLNMAAKRRKIFYGWVIVALGFMVMVSTGSCVFYSFGIFLKPMIADIGASRGTATIAYSIMMAIQGLLAPVTASLIGKYGTRKLMAAGLTLAATGLALMSTATQTWQLFLFFGVLTGTGVALGHFLPLSTMATFWFARKRALVIGLIMAGAGAGTFIMAPIIAYLIEHIGWRSTWLVLAGIVFTVAAIPSAIFARTRPEDVGLLPDGRQSSPLEHVPINIDKNPSFMVDDWDIKSALKTPAIWMITILNSANVFSMMMMNNHQVAHLTDLGFSPVIAASTLGILGGVSAIGRVSGGALGQKIPPRYLLAIAFLMEAIALVIFLNAQTTTAIYAYVILFGFAAGSIIVLHIAMIGNYYGAKGYAFLASTVLVVSTIIGAGSPVFGGYVYDALQSYSIPFYTCVGASVIGGISALMAKPPKRQALSM